MILEVDYKLLKVNKVEGEKMEEVVGELMGVLAFLVQHEEVNEPNLYGVI